MELLNEIWISARKNKLRTALTGFAVAWGIFMLIVLLGAGNGLINAQQEQSSDLLESTIAVFGGWTSKPYDGLPENRPIGLKDPDVSTTETAFPDYIDGVGALVYTNGQTLSLGDKDFQCNLIGSYPNHRDISKIRMFAGRYINVMDLKERRKVMVVSNKVSRELAKSEDGLLGKFVKVGEFAFKVVGVYKDDEDGNSDAFAPFTTIQVMYGKGNTVDRIEFSFHGLTTEAANERFEAAYRTAINANHRAAPDDDSAIWLWNRYTQSLMMEKGVGIIRMALWIVGLFTLLSGIVGVSNIMLITVKERTHEFGIRKAIGAKPWSILKLIIIESIIITTIFGYLGMVLGVLANYYMDVTLGSTQIDTGLFKASIFVNPTVGLDVCIEATAVMVIAGTVAGLIPAMKAARIRPIEALRAE